MFKQTPDTYIRVDVTSACAKVIARYAAMRGMTSGQVLFLALRYSLYKEALDRPDIRKLFKEEGIQFDPKVVAEWQSNIDQKKTLGEIFTPIPEEAFPGKEASILKMAGRFLFDAPKSLSDATWRLLSTGVLASCLLIGYGVVARPQLVEALFVPTPHKIHIKNLR